MKKIFPILFTLLLIFSSVFSQVSDKNKKAAKTAYNSAVENIQTMNFQAALSYLDAAVELDPGMTTALLQRAKVKVELGKTDDAIKDFKKVIEKDPGNGESYFYLGYLPFTSDTSQLIINNLNMAIQKGYKQPQAFYYRGMYYLLSEQYSEAINDFTSATELKPNYPLAYHNRASAKEHWAICREPFTITGWL
ncbi:MAG: tetratricopeptide repeat protein [Bacteroidales bacterium]|nr:tetratricopeptide repeat protein [Bacteroidales bacterium]